MASGDPEATAGNTVEGIAEHPVVETGARLGFAVNGVMHMVIAVLALQVAWGGSGQSADQSGALATLAGNSVGSAVLWLMLAGFTLLGVWQVSESVRPRGGETSLGGRAKGLAKTVVYVALAYSAFTFATGEHSSSSQQSVDFTARLMSAPYGPALVAVVGVIVLAVAAHHIYKGLRSRFLNDLEEPPGRVAVLAGQFGYVAKGVALAVVGALFLLAALHHQASEASGLDGALRTLAGQPFGPYLLSAVALGLGAYAVYSFARARHAAV